MPDHSSPAPATLLCALPPFPQPATINSKQPVNATAKTDRTSLQIHHEATSSADHISPWMLFDRLAMLTGKTCHITSCAREPVAAAMHERADLARSGFSGRLAGVWSGRS